MSMLIRGARNREGSSVSQENQVNGRGDAAKERQKIVARHDIRGKLRAAKSTAKAENQTRNQQEPRAVTPPAHGGTGAAAQVQRAAACGVIIADARAERCAAWCAQQRAARRRCRRPRLFIPPLSNRTILNPRHCHHPAHLRHENAVRVAR